MRIGVEATLSDIIEERIVIMKGAFVSERNRCLVLLGNS